MLAWFAGGRLPLCCDATMAPSMALCAPPSYVTTMTPLRQGKMGAVLKENGTGFYIWRAGREHQMLLLVVLLPQLLPHTSSHNPQEPRYVE